MLRLTIDIMETEVEVTTKLRSEMIDNVLTDREKTMGEIITTIIVKEINDRTKGDMSVGTEQ